MALNDKKSQRLYLDTPLFEGGKIQLARDQANYLLNVLRMNDGDSILVFNGLDGEWEGVVAASGRKKCGLLVSRCVRPQTTQPSLIYCFSPLKQARLDYMIQKAVEMGVGVLLPVITTHTQVRNLNEKRVLANAIEAAEQCGILTIPEIRSPVSLAKLAKQLPSDCWLVFCDENAERATLPETLPSEIGRIALLIGPEGGFSEEERKLLLSLNNIRRLGLGPRIMRADTAAVAALAIVQSRYGDWYEGNGRQQ